VEGPVESLHKGDRELLLKMISEICEYNENSLDTIANIRVRISHDDSFLFVSHNSTARIIK
jgi:hypothetical protein